MTTMNNEDPADPSVHEPRMLDTVLESSSVAIPWRVQVSDAVHTYCFMCRNNGVIPYILTNGNSYFRMHKQYAVKASALQSFVAYALAKCASVDAVVTATMHIVGWINYWGDTELAYAIDIMERYYKS